MNLKAFLAALRRHWLTFVVITALPLAAAVSWVLLTPAKYVSTTQLMVSIDGSTTATAYQNDEVVVGRVNSYIALLTSAVVNQRVVAALGLPETASDLAAKVSATNVPPKTALIDVAVTDQSPERAKLIASTLAREFITYTDALETPTGQDGQKVRTRVITAASEPHERRAERVILVALAALAGVVLGVVAVWVRARTDPLVRTADDVAAAAGVPVIGSVADGDHFDGYRRLRTRLRSVFNKTGEADDRGQVWVLASATGEVDTALVASNLARALEFSGSRSVVLETGIPEAGVANEPTPDSETESDDGPEAASAEPSIRHGADGFPDTLSMNAWAEDPDLSATKAAAELFDQLRNEYAHVIVAAPPVLTTITASIVSESADGVLLIVSLGETRRRDLGNAAENLRATGAPLTGAVLSGTKPVPDMV